MFKKKKREKKSDNIDSIEIPGEEEPNYAGLVVVYRSDIISRLEPKQILPYMASIDTTQSEKIKKIGEIDRVVATELLLDAIKQSRDRGIWREFMTALERTKYIALRQKLHGDSIHDDTSEIRYIEIMTPQLRQIINPCEITSALLSRDILIQDDVEEILCEANNRGSIAATDMLLQRVSGKHPKWYTELVAVLFTSGMSDAGDILLQGFNQCPRKSEDSESYLTRTQVPKTGVTVKHLRKYVKERNPNTGSSKEQPRPHSSVLSLTDVGTKCSSKEQPRPHSSVLSLTDVGTKFCHTPKEEQNYLQRIVQKREFEEHVYDEPAYEENPEDMEVKIPEAEISNNQYLSMDSSLTNELFYITPQEVADTKERAERETVYVCAVEDYETLYRGQRSFKKGDVIRVVKPIDGEEDDEYYQCNDKEGQLIPKICVDVVEIRKPERTEKCKSTSFDYGSPAPDTPIPENMMMTINKMLSELLKQQTLEQHDKDLKEQLGQREDVMKQDLLIPEDDDEDDLENITSLC
ncbi:uncharacterized protein LOC128236512 isoform X3 [Mya arenaria]|uniref:uncharacterized protein LOC128236512 isoform X3 n=1 Tax=Mya arenaria TaxID=6604 RepID=UPI0022DEDFC2|nr:uncharacterized protein LOC128236512 isoform X3 [Mya arenaria]